MSRYCRLRRVQNYSSPASTRATLQQGPLSKGSLLSIRAPIMVFSSIIAFFSFIYSNIFVLVFLGAVAAVFHFFHTQTVSRRGSRQISPIEEDEEDSEAQVSRPTSLAAARRIRKRDWIAHKIYKSLYSDDSPPGSSSPTGDTTPTDEHKARTLKRRHSTALSQVAKNILAPGHRRYVRQSSELQWLRGSLPRPPMEFFEPSALPEIPQNLQPEIFYVLHNLKMLELPAEWKLDPRDIEVISLAKGDYVVRPGDQDDSVIVNLEGVLNVYITHAEGKEYQVKRIEKGSSFFSVLSMLDILMANESKLRTVSLKAAEPSKVARYRIHSFRKSYLEHPQLWTRPIQVVITRLLHVTLTTLHQYMGLSAELMKRRLDNTGQKSEDRLRHVSGQSMKVKQNQRPRMARRLSSSDVSSDANEHLIMARRWMCEAFGLNPNHTSPVIDEKLYLQTYQEGDVLVEQGAEEVTLYIVVSGTLKLSQETIFEDDLNSGDNEDEGTPDNSSGNWLTLLQPKEIVGGLQLLTGEPAFYTVRAGSPITVVGVLTKKDFMEILDANPGIYLPVAHSVLKRLSPFLRGIDFALDWVLVDSGQAVYRQGDRADSLYVVLSGRLRSVEKKTVVEEFGRGDMLGMMEVLQKKPRLTTVLATRFSQLARVPEGLLNFVKMQFPQVGFRLVHLLGQYYTNSARTRFSVRGFEPVYASIGSGGDPMSHIKNLHTVALVAGSSDVPLTAFACELFHALSANLRVLRLSSEKVSSVLGPAVLERNADFRLMHWLNVQEDTYPLVIYECDATTTNWTRRCLRQADAILVVAHGHRKPSRQKIMEEHIAMNQDSIRTNKELILLWKEDTPCPRGTVEWLKGSWFSGHHHVRAPQRMYQWARGSNAGRPRSPIPEREIIEFYEKNVFWERVDQCGDFARLARILTGNAIGLVLGGGGAKGAAHVGVIRALKERGIPVDIVGGTSIGSMIGGVFAETPDVDELEERVQGWFTVMCSLWRKIYDLTYPYAAMFKGEGFNRTIQDLFIDRNIEDLWIPYFCISTDISSSEMRVHRSGPLWAYVRASMSLAGYLPPLCDPRDGHLLLDGGYVNNLPADVMRNLGAKCVIAVDVGAETEGYAVFINKTNGYSNLYNYGDAISGWWILWNRFNPFGESQRVLGMDEIQSRLAFVSSERQLETVKRAPYCNYLRPPIETYKTLDFAKFAEIRDRGYEFGKNAVQELMYTSVALAAALGGDGEPKNKKAGIKSESKMHKGEGEASFTDLAAELSKIPRVRRNKMESMCEPGGQLDNMLLEDSDAEERSSIGSSDMDGDLESEEDLHSGDERILTPRPAF